MPPFLLLVLAVLWGLLQPGSVCARPSHQPPKYLPPKQRDAFLGNLERSFSTLTTLRVHFRQTRSIPVFKQPIVSEGIIAFCRPDRLHWEWTRPFPSLIVLAESQVAQFDIDNGLVRRLHPMEEGVLRTVAQNLSSWILGRFRSTSGSFSPEVTAGETPSVVLLPRGKLGRILRSVTLEVTADRVHRVTLISSRGEETRIEFYEEKRNVKLPAGVFSLTHPVFLADSGASKQLKSTRGARSADGPG